MVIPIEVEPAFVALGPYYMAAGMNNRAWFYLIGDHGNVGENPVFPVNYCY